MRVIDAATETARTPSRGRLVLVAVLVSAALALTSSVAGANPDAVELNPARDGATYFASVGDEIILTYGVVAGTDGLTRVWAREIMYRAFLDGVMLIGSPEANTLFGPVEPYQASDCSFAGDPSVSWWRFQLSDRGIVLGPGVYTFYSDWSMSHPLTDLCDALDGNGIPDVYPAGVLLESTVTLVVSP